jgi:Delta7-sterol 5-desaturase
MNYWSLTLEINSQNLLSSIAGTGIAVFIGNLLRYLIIAGLAYAVFYIWKKEYWKPKKIQAAFPKPSQVQMEIVFSLSTFIIFGLTGIFITWLNSKGYGQIYFDISEYGLGYLVLSVFLSLVIHDTYFYWTHRFMHMKGVYKIFHKVHHLSHNPSPWAAFSFHPLEAIVEAGILPVLIFVIPIHPLAILAFLLVMTVMNVIGHLGYEIFPSGYTKHWFGKWNNTSTHHNMHHRLVKCNYGLYFNWWDQLMGTNHARYHEQFEDKASAELHPAKLPSTVQKNIN